MFNSELFEISEKAYKRIDKEDIQERNQRLEKEILKIIKAHSPYIGDNGVVEINYNSKTHEYYILNIIVSSHMQKYFEEEYSLYYIGKNYVPYKNGFGDYYILSFLWDSIEYNIKNRSNPKAEVITRKLNKSDHTI